MEDEYNEESYYHCSAEWHLARLSRGRALVPILYTFALLLSQKHEGRFYCSASRLAEHFGYERKAVYGALDILEQSGFFTLVSKQLGETNIYRVVTHKEWTGSHPGECVTKMEFAWRGRKYPFNKFYMELVKPEQRETAEGDGMNPKFRLSQACA